MLEEASRYLAEAQRFPATEPIAALLEEHKLLHVYNPQTINRAIIDILERADCLEVLSGIDVMLPTRVDADPDVLSERTGSLREALELTLLHAALAVRECDPELVNVVIAGNLVSSNIEITFDLEAITSAEEVLSFEDFRQTLRSAESVDAFWQNLPPVTIWTHAKEATEFALAIGLEAQRLRRIAGCQAPDSNCERFIIGPHFAGTLSDCQAIGAGKHATLTHETCARIVAKLPKSEPNRMFKHDAAGNKVDITRLSDDAAAYRAHVSGGHDGLRLMFWRRRDGSIELANVGNKSDLRIL